jgi:hypothetical protein
MIEDKPDRKKLKTMKNALIYLAKKSLLGCSEADGVLCRLAKSKGVNLARAHAAWKISDKTPDEAFEIAIEIAEEIIGEE